MSTNRSTSGPAASVCEPPTVPVATDVPAGRPHGVRRGRAGRATRAVGKRLRHDQGMTTAEYAVGTLAAVAFAGLLLKVVTSGTVQQALTNLFQRALG